MSKVQLPLQARGLHALFGCARVFDDCRTADAGVCGVLEHLLDPVWQPVLSTHILPHLSRLDQAALRCTCRRAASLPISQVKQLSIQPASIGRSAKVSHSVYPAVDTLELRVTKGTLMYFQGMVDESCHKVLAGIKTLVVWLGVADTHVSLTQVLTHLPKLERVQVWEATPGALHSLASLNPRLTKLDATMQMDLLAPEVSACFSQLGLLSELSSLSMGGFAFEEFPDLTSITHLTKLTALELWGIRCISAQNNMRHLSVLTGLLQLRIDVFDVSVDALTSLSHLSQLTKLDIQAFWVTNQIPSVTQALEFIPQLPVLKCLSIAAWAAKYMLPTLDVSLLGRCPALETLTYSGNIPMQGTVLCYHFPKLHTLDGYADLAEHLHTLSGLKSVTWHTMHLADSDRVSVSPVPTLAAPFSVTSLCIMSHRSHKPRWRQTMLRFLPQRFQEYLSVDPRNHMPPSPSPQALLELRQYTNLRELSLNCSATSSSTLSLIVVHMPHLTSLTLDLFLRDSSKVSDRGVARLGKCNSLEKLLVRHLKGVTVKGLTAAAMSPRLKWLAVEYCPRVGKKDMAKIRSLVGTRIGFDLMYKPA